MANQSRAIAQTIVGSITKAAAKGNVVVISNDGDAIKYNSDVKEGVKTSVKTPFGILQVKIKDVNAVVPKDMSKVEFDDLTAGFMPGNNGSVIFWVNANGIHEHVGATTTQVQGK